MFCSSFAERPVLLPLLMLSTPALLLGSHRIQTVSPVLPAGQAAVLGEGFALAAWQLPDCWNVARAVHHIDCLGSV